LDLPGFEFLLDEWGISDVNWCSSNKLDALILTFRGKILSV
jgi:hypothetical protein